MESEFQDEMKIRTPTMYDSVFGELCEGVDVSKNAELWQQTAAKARSPPPAKWRSDLKSRRRISMSPYRADWT